MAKKQGIARIAKQDFFVHSIGLFNPSVFGKRNQQLMTDTSIRISQNLNKKISVVFAAQLSAFLD